MTEPRRLIQSGGISQRLLDSASIDRPGPAARRHAAALAATANAFARTSSSGSGTYRTAGRSAGAGRPVKTVVTWLVVGAAASVALGLAGSRLLGPSSASRAEGPLASLPTLSPAAPAGSSPDIAPEPPVALPRVVPVPVAAPAASGEAAPTHIEPWVPSLVTDAAGAPRVSGASANEVLEIEAARAALSRGDAVATITQLDAYDSAHPQSQLKPEAMILRIQALSVGDKTAEALALARSFVERYPRHPQVQQVKAGILK